MLREFRKLFQRVDPQGAASYDINRGIQNYQEFLYVTLHAFLSGTRTLEQAKKDVADAAASAFVIAFYAGFGDGNGTPTQQDRKWLIERYAKELTYIDTLFVALAAKKDGERLDIDYLTLALAHALGYSKTMLGIYNQAKLRATLDILLSLGGPDGRESCSTCQGLKGKLYPASWWIENELIPGPENGYNYECKGFNCDHRLFDLAGRQYTL